MRNVGITWTDPDLTDTTSGDSHDGSARKQEHLEIESPDPTPEAAAVKKAATKKQGNRGLKDPSSCGSRLRRSGRWSAEIGFRGSRIWLGTFDTMEEARTAYLSKKIEIEAAKLSNSSGGDSVVVQSGKKTRKSDQPRLADPIEKSGICGGDGGRGSERNGDWAVAEGSPKGKRKSERPYTGVFLRSGKWYAEVRDPIKKCKKWLGHYGSPEEARAAIVAKKLEFDAIKLNLKEGEWVASSVQAIGGSGDGDSVGCGNWAVQGSGSPESSGGGEDCELAVLKRFTEDRASGVDLNSVMQIASHIIDSYGNFVGEFSYLDDLQIC